jgi:hypothetical protein
VENVPEKLESASGRGCADNRVRVSKKILRIQEKLSNSASTFGAVDSPYYIWTGLYMDRLKNYQGESVFPGLAAFVSGTKALASKAQNCL